MVTLGCARNEVDSEELAARLEDGGWQLADDAQDADVICHEYGHSIQDNQVPGWGQGQIATATEQAPEQPSGRALPSRSVPGSPGG